jgi:excisionase family DNA binding protein
VTVMRENSRYLRVSQAAAHLGVCAETVRTRFDAGLLAGTRTASGARLIERSSLGVPQLLSISAAAQRLGVSAETVRNWFDAGKLWGARSESGRRLVSLESIEAASRD